MPVLSRPHPPARLLRPLLAVLSISAMGCGTALMVPSERVPEPVAALPATFARGASAVPDSALAYRPFRWYEAFGDPVLGRLLDSVSVANLDLAEAVARVDEAQARAGVTRAALLPAVSASGNGTYSDSPANTGQFGAQATGAPADSSAAAGSPADRISFTTTSVSLGVQYELDFWGRARNETRAAVGDVYAALADLETARLGVLAQTIGAYFELVDLRRRIALTVETLSLLDDRLAVTEDRYQRGLVGSFELYQLRQDFRSTQASLPQLERQHADAAGRLATLAGLYPSELSTILPDSLAPALPDADVPAGLPVDLLLQRPDVLAAAYRYESARHRVGAARAQLFPSLSLGGSVGLQADDVGGLLDLDQWIANLTAGLTAPLFQGGRLRANVDAAEAAYRRTAAAYTRSVLTSVREVETALEAHEEERQRYALVQDQLREAAAAAALQAERYRRGVGDSAGYLDALRAETAVQTQLSSAARAVALARLDVHRALGGGWTATDRAPRLALAQGDVAAPREGALLENLPLVGIPPIPDALPSEAGWDARLEPERSGDTPKPLPTP